MIPWTIACQAPLSMEFFRQECWSGLPLIMLLQTFMYKLLHSHMTFLRRRVGILYGVWDLLSLTRDFVLLYLSSIQEKLKTLWKSKTIYRHKFFWWRVTHWIDDLLSTVHKPLAIMLGLLIFTTKIIMVFFIYILWIWEKQNWRFSYSLNNHPFLPIKKDYKISQSRQWGSSGLQGSMSGRELCWRGWRNVSLLD